VNGSGPDLPRVAPRLVVGDGAAAIDFYTQAFGARETGERFVDSEGRLIHAEVQFGASIVMITEEGGDSEAPAKSPGSLGGVVTTILATYWEDVDPAWQRAVAAGGEVVYPLADQFYGERSGRLRDPWGHQWMLSQRIEELTQAELERRASELFGRAE